MCGFSGMLVCIEVTTLTDIVAKLRLQGSSSHNELDKWMACASLDEHGRGGGSEA